MSNIIPPLLSNTPPPPPSPDEDEDDEFGDFTGAQDLSYSCDNLSLPPSPDHSPKKVSSLNGLDINSNSEKNSKVLADLEVEKDFQDKRKSIEKINICNLEEKYIDNIEENILEYPTNTVGDIHLSDTISGNHFDAHLMRRCSLNCIDDKILKNHGNIKSENNLNSNRHLCDDTNNGVKSQHIVQKNIKTLNFNKESNSKEEEIYNLSNDLTNVEPSELTKENLKIIFHEPKVNCAGSKLEEGDSYGSNSNINSNYNKIAENLNPDDIAYTIEAPFEEVHFCNEKSMLKSYETSHEGLISKLKNKDITNNEDTCEIQSGSEDKFDDFVNSDDINIKQSAETYFCKNDKLYQHTQNIQSKSQEDSSKEVLIFENISEKMEACNVEDDFDDFCDFTSNSNVQDSNFNDGSSKPEDDFGKFSNFFDSVEQSVTLELNEKEAFEKANSILKDIFPVVDHISEDFQYVDVESSDFIFNELKDITETNALTYLWSKSASQNMLLKALNIDARNILYGTSWNPSMPRFAANLGLTPLEPIKSEMSPSTLKPIPSSSSKPPPPPSNEIPCAQFDWNGSGLVNPLDSVSKEPIEVQQASLTEKSLELPVEQTVLKPQVVPQSMTGPKLPSKNDLEEDVISIDKNTDDFEDFTSYQSSAGSESWPNIVPLRETYISNDAKELPLDISNWLQPTIVTPELPRKDLETGDEELPNIQTPEFTRKEVVLQDNTDEFDDFHMVLPETTVQNKYPEMQHTVSPDILNSMEQKYVEPAPLHSLNVANFDFANVNFLIEKPKLTSTLNMIEANHQKHPLPDEDEFTEFHSSAPPAITPKPLVPLEPLQPVPVYLAPAAPTQINWPDPGITDDEIKKFDMVFQQPQDYNSGENKKSSENIRNTVKESSCDDDEWSEFVSVSKPSPVHKFQLSEKERTSSPDLPLSVLNLGNIQPTKQPIPVITAQGLIQTKLYSNNSLNLSPKMQLKNNSVNIQKPTYNRPQFQPSIISNQFASQAYGFNHENSIQSKIDLNFPVSASNNHESVDDDDWSDFISSPLPATSSNGFQQNWQSTSTSNQAWINPSPNIISNPGHFIQSGSDMKNKKVSNISVSKNSTVPSIVLPELEFIAPKERTFSSKKK